MTRKCPICKRLTDSDRDAEFPFCSERCRLTDLGAWSAGKYVVSDPIFDEDDLAEIKDDASRTEQSDDLVN